ncbi:MAG: N-glycosylase/DNA lyase [Candidatus Baldrarchaeia archaeon]
MDGTAEVRLLEDKLEMRKSREDLINVILVLTENMRIKELVDARLREFKAMKEKSSQDWFIELCFCILTANSSAEAGIRAQWMIGDGFLHLPKEQLKQLIKRAGCRFYRRKAEYIVVARKYADILKQEVTSYDNETDARDWLVKTFKGIGYKEGSHFLRNVGYDNVAILDRHILSILTEFSLIDSIPKHMTRRRYFEIERVFINLADNIGISPAALDLYLWYLKTGKILK